MNAIKIILLTIVNLILSLLLMAPFEIEMSAINAWFIAIIVFVLLLTPFSSFYMWKIFMRLSRRGKIAFLIFLYLFTIWGTGGISMYSVFDMLYSLLIPIVLIWVFPGYYLGGIIMLAIHILNKRKHPHII